MRVLAGILTAVVAVTVGMQPPRLSYNRPGRPTIIVAAPTRRDPLYGDYWRPMALFLADYGLAVSQAGVDNFILLGDDETLAMIKRERPGLPFDVFLRGPQEEPWMRDFTTARMSAPVSFAYLPRYHSRSHATSTQATFTNFLAQCGLNLPSTSIVMDGGNLVDNDIDMGIVTDRIYADNPRWNRARLRAELSSKLGLSRVAVIPEYPGDTTGHADGMVSFLDANTVALTDLYPITRRVKQALRSQLGSSVRLLDVANNYIDSTYEGFSTACGIHVNLLSTDGALYVPTFGSDRLNRGQSTRLDNQVLAQIRNAVGNRKRVVPVPVPNFVCKQGGNVRCLSWQVKGAVADALVAAARNGGCPGRG